MRKLQTQYADCIYKNGDDDSWEVRRPKILDIEGQGQSHGSFIIERYIMKINEFIQKYRKVKKLVPGMTSSHTPHVICKDGFKMSVQAGQSLYSAPKDVTDSYEEVEVGFPSTEESLLTTYAEDEENLCGTVYGYVPCSIIDEVIEKHGGIDESKIEALSNEK